MFLCGIIGCISSNAQNLLVDGLLKMEYRGYDSSGLAYVKDYQITTRKTMESPKKLLGDSFSIGIGHTRWATHGEVNLINAHPHLSIDNKIAIVHNGIIENYQALKKQYLNNIILQSETDTEVIVNLIALFYQQESLLSSIQKTINLLQGSYAFLILDCENNIYYAVKNMPLILGKGGGLFVASDVLAFPLSVNEICYLENNSYGKITDNYKFKQYKLFESSPTLKENIMLDEIKEIPNTISKISTYFNKENVLLEPIFNLYYRSKTIGLIGCGSSYNACLIAKYLIEKHSDKNVFIYNASEFLFQKDNNMIDLFFVLSQSGETADSLLAIDKIKDHKIIAITNVVTSTITKKVHYVIDMCAYPEIAVASTKAYAATVFIFYSLIGIGNLELIKQSIYKVLNLEKEIALLAKKYRDKKYFIFLGKGIDYFINFENILKIKEVTYSYVNNYLAGELKHGPLALCDENTVVFAINSSSVTNYLFRSNISEVKSRKSEVLIFSGKDNYIESDYYHFFNNDDLTLFECIVFFELFAFYLSIVRGINPDRPKNLAKSVTVQ